MHGYVNIRQESCVNDEFFGEKSAYLYGMKRVLYENFLKWKNKDCHGPLVWEWTRLVDDIDRILRTVSTIASQVVESGYELTITPDLL